MDEMAKLPATDRRDLWTASAAKRGFNFTIIEKDFWACWVLKQLFGLHDPPAGLVFKGGTSLSKVWGVIDRFSEDVDLSFNRSDLGFGGDSDPAKAGSTKKRDRQLEQLSAACAVMIREQFVPRLNEAFHGYRNGDAYIFVGNPRNMVSMLTQRPEFVDVLLHERSICPADPTICAKVGVAFARVKTRNWI